MSGESEKKRPTTRESRQSTAGLSHTPDAEVPELVRMYERIASLTETNRQLKRKIFDLYTIFEISRDFNSVLDYKSLLDSLLLY